MFHPKRVIKYGICFFIALPFLFGLILFMGVFWWPWALLVAVLYLPWRWLDQKLAPAAPKISIDGRGARWLIGATAVLLAVHIVAVAAQHEWEPIYSHYPMYAAGMRAGNKAERAFLERYKDKGRHYRWDIQIAGMTPQGELATRDLGPAYAVASFLHRNYGTHRC